MTTVDGFPEIYTSYWSKIVGYLIRMVGPGEAEDLAQEVFLKVSRALPGFRGDSSLSTWLYRIATNAAFDRMRNPSFRNSQVDQSIEKLSDGKACSSTQDLLIEQLFVKREMGTCILGYVASLPEIYHSVLVLSDMEGLSNNEIAEILNVPLSTVKIRLHRARAQLREELETGCEYYWTSELDWLPV